LERRANFVGTNFGGGESEGGTGIHFPHTPFSARPARAFSLAREARHQFRSKKVRAFSNKGHHVGKVKEFWFASLRSATNLYSILGTKTNWRFRILGEENF